MASTPSARETEDVTSSAKEFIGQVEKLCVAYRRGSKAHDLTSNSNRALTDSAGACQKSSESLDSLGNSSEVMKSHAQTAIAATAQVKQITKVLAESHHILFHGWAVCTGASERVKQ